MYDDNRERQFYEVRDKRTFGYLRSKEPFTASVLVRVGIDASESPSGQTLVLSLANMLCRIHRNVGFVIPRADVPLLVPSLFGQRSLRDELYGLTTNIDPYGRFDIEAVPTAVGEIVIGIGSGVRERSHLYIGSSGWIAEIGRTSIPFRVASSADTRGACLAAVLGAAAACRKSLGWNSTVPSKLSLWNFARDEGASQGPIATPPLDVGRTLVVGAGAVGAALGYWLLYWGTLGSWTIIDGDIVKLHNLNRSLLYFLDDTDWAQPVAAAKAAVWARRVPNAIHERCWYDESQAANGAYDTVVPIANERSVRTLVARRLDPIQVHATTGTSWLSQVHRHAIGADDCVRCRMSDVREPQFGCSSAKIQSATIDAQSSDAALPFLSAASGLMLASVLQQLQVGELWKPAHNSWRWDFHGTTVQSSRGRYRCRSDCDVLVPEAALQIANGTRWKDRANDSIRYRLEAR